MTSISERLVKWLGWWYKFSWSITDWSTAKPMQSLLNFSPRWNLIVTLNFCDIFRLSNSCSGLSLKDLLFHWKYQVPCCDLLFICQALLFWCLVKNQVLAQKSTLEPSTTALNLLFIQKHKRKISKLFLFTCPCKLVSYTAKCSCFTTVE